MHTRRMRGLVGASLLAMACAATAGAQGSWQPGDFGSVRFRMGLFEPDAESEYWQDKFADFTGSASDVEDLSWGFDYLWRTSGTSGFLFGTSFYEGATTQAYRDWVDGSGNDISHTTSLELWDTSVVFLVRIGRGSVAPYLGVGGGFVYWSLEESGYFIDFGDPGYPVVFSAYITDGWTYEGIALAGIDLRLGYQWSLFVEGRYRISDDELGDAFAGFGEIDLSGSEVSAGLSWNF